MCIDGVIFFDIIYARHAAIFIVDISCVADLTAAFRIERRLVEDEDALILSGCIMQFFVIVCVYAVHHKGICYASANDAANLIQI